MINAQAKDALIRAKILEILELSDTEFIKKIWTPHVTLLPVAMLWTSTALPNRRLSGPARILRL